MYEIAKFVDIFILLNSLVKIYTFLQIYHLLNIEKPRNKIYNDNLYLTLTNYCTASFISTFWNFLEICS
jgi:hypothetical protein